MIDFFGSGYDAAERLGLLRELEAIHHPIARLSFLTRDGATRFSVSYETMRHLLGGRHFSFMRGDLERVLFDALARPAQVRFGSSIDSFTQDDDGIEAMLRDGSKERADLLVGADGIHSKIRRLAFGEEKLFVRPLGYHTAAFVFDDPEPQADIGDAFATVTTPGRQVALFPIRGGRVATFWVHRSDAAILDGSAEAAARELREVYAGPRLADPQGPRSPRRSEDFVLRRRGAGCHAEVERGSSSAARFTAELTNDAPLEWRDEIEQVRIEGSLFVTEVIFFHRPSSTCLVGDLIQKHGERDKSAWPRWLLKVGGVAGPNGGTPRDARWSFVHRRRAREAVSRVLAWAPERLVIAHGTCSMANGTEVLHRSFRWLL